ncbi:MAG: hypothetical protein IKQ36_03650 [Clostridia bacterium]|nr:hypothetical protein [Clostridia bacterium]
MSKKHRKRPHIPTGGETVEAPDMIGPDFIGTEGMRTASASEYTGLMYAPPGDFFERRSYNEIEPIVTDPAREG